MENNVKIFQGLFVLVLLLSIGVLIYITWCGLGLTYDSHDYLSAASGFRASGTFLNKDGQPFIAHAPLFPLFVTILGESPIIILKWVNLLFYTISMVIIMQVVWLLIRNKLLGLGVYFAIAFAVGVQMIHSFAWSEPLFFVLFAFHNWSLVKYLKNVKLIDFGILTLSALLMCLIRNAGFFIILPTALILYFNISGKRAAYFYFIISAFGFTLWNFYAFFIQDGIDTFRKGLSLFTAIELNFINYLDIISAWFLPSFIPVIPRILLLLISILIFSQIFRLKKISKEGKIYLLQSAAYICILIIFISVYISDVERYLAVIYPWFMIGVFSLVDSSLVSMTRISKRLFIILISFWLFYVSARTIKNSIMWNHNNCTATTLHNLDSTAPHIQSRITRAIQ